MSLRVLLCAARCSSLFLQCYLRREEEGGKNIENKKKMLNKFKGYEVLVDFNENIRTHVRRMDELLTLLYPSYYFLRISDMSRFLISKVYPYCQKIISHLARSKDSVTYGTQLYEAALDRFGDLL